jgi:integrase
LRKALLVAYANHEKHWPTVDWVIHRKGEQLITYRKEWERARKEIGCEDLRFHDFRHAAVTKMLEAGIDEARVMAIVGHRTFAMLKRYRIVADRHTVEAGRKLEAWQEAQKAEQKRKAEPEARKRPNRWDF